MSTIQAFIRRHPVLTYFALTFAISWSGLLLIGPGGTSGTPEQFESLLPVVSLALLAGPSVAGLLLTGLVYGRAGFRELLSRLLRWWVGARWYAWHLIGASGLCVLTRVRKGSKLGKYLSRRAVHDSSPTPAALLKKVWRLNMRRVLPVIVCLLLVTVTAEAKGPFSCTLHIQMTHATPSGTITKVRVVALGGTKIVQVLGYAWSVQPAYPASATLVPPPSGPEHLSMISVVIDSQHAAGAQKIDIEWLGGEPLQVLCHRVLDVACSRTGVLPISVERRAVGTAAGALVGCRLVTAEVIADGPIDTTDGDCEPSFDVKALGCATYKFTNTTEYDVIGPPAQYTWSVALDDGDNDIPLPLANPSAENQTITFPGPGTYVVALEAFGAPCGDESEITTEEIVVPDLSASFAVTHLPTAPFAIQLQNQSAGEALSYSWDFGDNTPPSTLANPAHVFSTPGAHNVCLTATSADGCETQNCKTVKISDMCVLDFTWAYKACATTPPPANGYDVDFTNTSSPAADGSTSYVWTFGDGSLPESWTGVNITHHYASEGTYHVTLMAPECLDQPHDVTVHQCTADFRWLTCPDGRVVVTNSDSSSSSSWDFPGGKPSSGSGSPTSTHYKEPGPHPITLTSQDAALCTCEKTHEVTTQKLCCRKNQQWAETMPPFDYDGNSYKVRIRLAVHNHFGAHRVRVKMVVRKKKNGHYKLFKAHSLNIQWSGTIFRKSNDCRCNTPETASDNASELDKKRVKKTTPMNGRFWTRLASVVATYNVRIDANDTNGHSWQLALSKPCN